MPYKFSPSSLSLLKDCPRCFWLKFNKNIKRPEGIFPSLPSGMDRILKTHFDSFMEKNQLPPELCKLLNPKDSKGLEKSKTFLKDECKDLKLFDDKELLKEWRNNRKGVRWEDHEHNIFMGAVDNILKNKDKLIVLDYKTRGYPLKEDTAQHYQDQLDIYNLLLRKNNYETEDFAYLLFYHPDKVLEDGKVIFNTDLVKMKVDVKNAENIFKEALKVLKGDIPSPSKECEYCEFAKLL